MALEEAKARYKAEKSKVLAAANSIVGSRVALAGLTVLAIAFGAHLVFAPERLPPLGGFGLVQVGLPPLDFGAAGDVAREARDAAVREGAPGRVEAYVAGNPMLRVAINALGFALSVILLIWNVAVNARDRRYRAQPFGA